MVGHGRLKLRLDIKKSFTFVARKVPLLLDLNRLLLLLLMRINVLSWVQAPKALDFGDSNDMQYFLREITSGWENSNLPSMHGTNITNLNKKIYLTWYGRIYFYCELYKRNQISSVLITTKEDNLTTLGSSTIKFWFPPS